MRKKTTVASMLKTPSTKRSRLTVDAILQSLASLCAQYSYEEVTTNLVAERAGVSVGAVYQYFRNKEAIAIALYEEISSRIATRIREAILEDINEPLEQTICKTLTILLKCYQEHRTVLIDMPDADARLRNAVRHLSVVDLIGRSSRIYMEQHPDEVGPADTGLLRYFMGSVVKGCMRDYVVNPPPELSDEVFVAELSKILALYARAQRGASQTH